MAELPQSILCHPMSLADYAKFCCTGRLPQNVAAALSQAAQDPTLKAILCAMEIVGALEPLSATRPGVCDPVIVIDRDIVVPPATTDIDTGVVTPSEQLVTAICAPMNRALVVQKSRVTAANLTAARQPVVMPIYKRVNLASFGEWCLPFEPTDGPNSFHNIEHIIVPAMAGYSIYVQNWNPTSEAVYHYHAKMWASC